jgi:20S proteasome alpha/beta subunit
MTCVAWDGVTLAADKRATCSGYPATVTKIARAPTGELVGTSGDSDAGRALIAWFLAGAIPEQFPDNRGDDGCHRARLLVISPGPRITIYEAMPHPITIEDKFFAMGSGRDHALAVMYLGRTARKAVEVACALDTGCGNGIDTLRLK